MASALAGPAVSVGQLFLTAQRVVSVISFFLKYKSAARLFARCSETPLGAQPTTAQVDDYKVLNSIAVAEESDAIELLL